MKIRSYLFLGTLLALTFITANSFVHSYTSSTCDAPNIGGGNTGAPGEGSCGQGGCHSGVINGGPAITSLNIGGGVTEYALGQTYNVDMSIEQASVNKFGFQIVALKDSDNTFIGSYTLTDPTNTRAINAGSRQYVGTTACGSDASPPDSLGWTFDWTAPSADVGAITFYLITIATNHNHSGSGDNVYTQTLTLGAPTPNIAPTANDDFAFATEGSTVYIDVQANDIDNDQLTTSTYSGPNNGTAVVLNGDSIEYTVNAGFTGSDTIVYVVCDNGVPVLCDTAMVTITVTMGVGIEGLSDEVEYRVFPIPTSDYLLISSANLDKPKKVALVNLIGQSFNFSFDETEHVKLDLRDIPNGMYLLIVDQQPAGRVVIAR